MPAKFKEEFPNTFAILDCTALKIQRPSSLVFQSQTYSTYKSTNTLKSLVACDPQGAVIYVSALFTGAISDKEIFNECNILDILKGYIQCGYLNVGDGLMVDKGFLIEKEVEEIGQCFRREISLTRQVGLSDMYSSFFQFFKKILRRQRLK
ncbi:hypothetical protein QQF64_036036 [Cirrhinus molitorella]|uniref:DDE Tnp4 domain-containing protein n=1 Tax=Cirrhinus molitorella TaxID=172907 RepID=A0ABR3NI96_9TELE